jgi:hypothetical protein
MEVFATRYRHPGINPATATINDPAGRPQHVIEAEPMKELI